MYYEISIASPRIDATEEENDGEFWVCRYVAPIRYVSLCMCFNTMRKQGAKRCSLSRYYKGRKMDSIVEVQVAGIPSFRTLRHHYWREKKMTRREWKRGKSTAVALHQF